MSAFPKAVRARTGFFARVDAHARDAQAKRDEDARWKAKYCEGTCCMLRCCNSYGGGVGTEREGES